MVMQAFEKGEYAIGVFFDFSKAVDTVDLDVLLDKLDHYETGVVLFPGLRVIWAVENDM